jgi:hypothetical protein
MLLVAGCITDGQLLVRGTVRSATSGDPLPGATVAVGDNPTATTGPDGAYRVDHRLGGIGPFISGANPTVRVSAPGYQPMSASLRGTGAEGVSRRACDPAEPACAVLDVALLPGDWSAEPGGARCAECVRFAENRQWPVKGGIASIGDGLFVGVNTPTNEVIIQVRRPSEPPREVRWTGKPADQREVVAIHGGRVVPWSDLPPDFDLSRAVVVSFEADRVRFFDFARARGGFYARAR